MQKSPWTPQPPVPAAKVRPAPKPKPKKEPREVPVRRTTTDEIPVPPGVPVIDWGNGKFTAYWNSNHKGKA